MPSKARECRKYRVTVPAKAHPLVKTLFAEMQKQQICILDVAERSGVSDTTITNWRYTKSPRVETLEACLNVVGLELTVKGGEQQMNPIEFVKTNENNYDVVISGEKRATIEKRQNALTGGRRWLLWRLVRTREGGLVHASAEAFRTLPEAKQMAENSYDYLKNV